MASNYDMPKLVLGQVVATVGLLFAMAAVSLISDDGLASFTPLIMVTLGYGVMMFASSYVEEEHHFWYWTSTAWLAFVGFKGMDR
jgi:ethanolamine phosphate transferase 2 subunit G